MSDKNKFRNAIAFTILTSIFKFYFILAGIPIIYYGDEQSFNGGDDPYNREPLFGRM